MSPAGSSTSLSDRTAPSPRVNALAFTLPAPVPPERGGSLPRRAALSSLGLSLLAACGFEPLYGQREGSIGARAATELSKVRVAPISERNGVLLRRALEDRIRTGPESATLYELRCGLTFGLDIQGFRQDGTPSRVRYTGTASWFLFNTTQPPRLVASGVERTIDAFNMPENQFFAADASRYAMEQRLIDQLAQDIVERLALALGSRSRQQDQARS